MKQALTNIGWLLLDKFLRLFVGLFIMSWLARYLGPEQFGVMNFVTAMVAIFGVFATLGLKGIVVRELVEHEAQTNKIIANAFVLKLVGSFAVYFLLLWAIFFLKPDDTHIQLFVAIMGLSLVFKSSEVVSFYFEAKVQSKYVVWLENGTFIFASLIKLILLYINAPLIAFIIAILVESALVAIALLSFYAVKISPISLGLVSIRQMKTLFAHSWPLIISSAAWVIYTRVDQIMLGQLVNPQAVGYYSVAVKLSELANMLPMIITFSLVPLISQLRHNNRQQYLQKFQMIYDIVIWLMLATAIMVTFFEQHIISLLFGQEYLSATPVLVIHIWSTVFVAMATVSGKYLLNEGWQKMTMYRHVSGVLINIPLNIYMIPLYGIEGAALASLISLAITNYGYDALTVKTRVCFKQKTKALLAGSVFELMYKRIKHAS